MHFNVSEMVCFLRQRGYVVTKESIEMYNSVYHNDVECKEQMVWTVKLNGKEIGKPVACNFGTETWLSNVFWTEMKKTLLNLSA